MEMSPSRGIRTLRSGPIGPWRSQRRLGKPTQSACHRRKVCFGTGAGGSLVIADADRGLTVAYVMNRMAPYPIVTPIAAALVERVYNIVGRYSKVSVR